MKGLLIAGLLPHPPLRHETGKRFLQAGCREGTTADSDPAVSGEYGTVGIVHQATTGRKNSLAARMIRIKGDVRRARDPRGILAGVKTSVTTLRFPAISLHHKPQTIKKETKKKGRNQGASTEESPASLVGWLIFKHDARVVKPPGFEF